MKAVKIVVSILIALVAVLAVVIFIGLKNLNSLVEMAIESVGPNVTKTAVTVDRVDLEVTKGYGEIYGIVVKNPAGYTTENAVDLGKIILHIEPASLPEPVILIKELSIDGAKITAEHKGLAEINLQDLYKNIIADARPQRVSTPTTARPDLRFMLEKVSFTNMSLDLISADYGKRALSMADIYLNNLGNKQTGLTAEELANVLLTPMIDAARQRVKNEIEAAAKEKLQDTVEQNLFDGDKQKVDALKSWLDN